MTAYKSKSPRSVRSAAKPRGAPKAVWDEINRDLDREALEYEKVLREALKPFALRAETKGVKARKAKPTKRR